MTKKKIQMDGQTQMSEKPGADRRTRRANIALLCSPSLSRGGFRPVSGYQQRQSPPLLPTAVSVVNAAPAAAPQVRHDIFDHNAPYFSRLCESSRVFVLLSL